MKRPEWKMIHPKATIEHLGILPFFLFEADSRPAREQIDERYQHGGGWRPSSAKLKPTDDKMHLTYPGDEPFFAIAETKLRDEHIIFYDCSWLAIYQPDGTFEVSRVD